MNSNPMNMMHSLGYCCYNCMGIFLSVWAVERKICLVEADCITFTVIIESWTHDLLTTITGIDGGHVTASGLLLPTSVIEPAWSTMHLKLWNFLLGKYFFWNPTFPLCVLFALTMSSLVKSELLWISLPSSACQTIVAKDTHNYSLVYRCTDMKITLRKIIGNWTCSDRNILTFDNRKITKVDFRCACYPDVKLKIGDYILCHIFTWIVTRISFLNED